MSRVTYADTTELCVSWLPRSWHLCVWYHSLGIYHGMLECVIMIIRTKMLRRSMRRPGASVLAGAAAGTQLALSPVLFHQHHRRWQQDPPSAQKINIRVGQKVILNVPTDADAWATSGQYRLARRPEGSFVLNCAGSPEVELTILRRSLHCTLLESNHLWLFKSDTRAGIIVIAEITMKIVYAAALA